VTHDELKAKIFQEYATTYEDLAGNVPMSPKALLAVVELHKPIETYNMNNVHKSWLTCNHCNDEIYPCPTIQAIEKELK
jgi:hypothetical protein